MNSTALRLSVAAVILAFAWKGSVLDVVWPPPPATVIDGPAPDARLLKWAEGVVPIAKTMLPVDRIYLSNLYDAMSFVLLRDGQRDAPIVSTTEKFAKFHSGSLRLAIDKESVGKYPGLDAAIDEVFAQAGGPEVKAIDQDTRDALIAACQVLSWTFGIHRDE